MRPPIVTGNASGTPRPRRLGARALGLALLLLTGGDLALAQIPPAGSGARMPPQSGQPPTSGGQPERPRGPHQPGGTRNQEPKKDKKLERFGPIGFFPLSLVWGVWLSGPPVVGAVSNGSLYFVATASKHVHAYDVRSGTSLWTLQDVAPVQPLAVDQGRLVVVLDQEIAAFEAASGKPLWRIPTNGVVSTPPVVKAGWLILALESGEVRALRGETGEAVWQTKLDAVVKTPPVIIGDRLYLAPQNNHLLAFDLISGQTLWNQEFDGVISALAAQGERVFAGTNRMFFGLDHAGQVRWKWRIGTEVIGTPVTDAANVYVAFADNTLRAFDAGKGGMRWRTALAYRPIAGPVLVTEGLLLTQITPLLHVYDTDQGKLAGDFPLPVYDRTMIVGSPVFVRGATFFEDTVLLPVAQGYLVALRRQGPGVLSPFIDLGAPCPPLAMPGEPPPPATASVPGTPPKP